mgnify:CR=1 FL=1
MDKYEISSYGSAVGTEPKHTTVEECDSEDKVTAFLQMKSDLAYDYYVTEWDTETEEILNQINGDDWLDGVRDEH